MSSSASVRGAERAFEREGWNGTGGGGGRRDQYRAALEGEVRPSPVGHSVNLTTLKPNDDGIHQRDDNFVFDLFPV